MKSLRWIRLFFASVFLAAMTILFVSPTERVVKWVEWLPEIQFVPAIAAGATLIVISIFGFTILFGRVYCSIICPLGIAQDFFRYIFKRFHTKCPCRDFRMSDRTLWIIRIVFLLCFVMLVFIELTAILEPYAIFGRMISLAREIVDGLARGQGLVGRLLSRLHFSGGEVLMPLHVSVTIALVSGLIFCATFFRARWWCNTVCPVGTLLGIISRWSLFRVRVHSDKCVGCGLCAKSCASGAIVSGKPARVDNSRCVDCLACVNVCKKEALKWH